MTVTAEALEIRPIDPADKKALVQGFERLGDQSRFAASSPPRAPDA